MTREDAAEGAAEFRATVQRRRTVRDFSADPVPYELVRDAVAGGPGVSRSFGSVQATAATAPSGANLQP